MDAPKFSLDDSSLPAAAGGTAPSGAAADASQLQPAPVIAEAVAADAPVSLDLGSDSWTLSDAESTATNTPTAFNSMPVASDFAEIAPGGEAGRFWSQKRYLYGAFAVVALLLTGVLLLPSEEAQVAPELVTPAPAAVVPKVAAVQVVPKSAVLSGNPYWALPNVKPEPLPFERVWTSQDEEIYRAGLAHRFSYQHHKTVEAIRKNRLSGSEVLLSEAMLGEPKLWTRMQAAFGHVEMGGDIDPVTMQRVIADARSSQLYNYLRRFRAQASASELYVMRQMIRVVDSRTRLLILQILQANSDSLAGVYLTAGTFDPAIRVHGWAKAAVQQGTVSATDFAYFSDVVRGQVSYAEASLSRQQPSDQGLADEVTKVSEYRVEKTIARAIDTSGSLSGADDVQDVEFYGEAKDEQTLLADPDDGFDEFKAKTIEAKQGI